MSQSVFCVNCRQHTTYTLQSKQTTRTIRDKKYVFSVTAAICDRCGQEVSPHGLIDQNVQEIDTQYRAQENLVSISDIEKLMKIYNIGNRPLSLALGFGEITIARYLEGQVPSKEYSDIIRGALTSPARMRELLNANRDRVSDVAFTKAIAAVESIVELFTVSRKMLRVIACIFDELKEVTPLMLQKILYFVQAVHLGLYGRPIFPEDCMAWLHGPVFPQVYELFKGFKYNPIDDDRFALIQGVTEELTGEEMSVIQLVVNTFGIYGGKTLERITHQEEPWQKARRGYGEDIPSNEVLTKESIQQYYREVNRQYGIDREQGIMSYITDMLSKV